MDWEGFFLEQGLLSPNLVERCQQTSLTEQYDQVHEEVRSFELEVTTVGPRRDNLLLQPLLHSTSGNVCQLALECLEAFNASVLVKELDSFREIQKCITTKHMAQEALSCLAACNLDRSVSNHFHWICLCVIAAVPTPDSLDLLSNHVQSSSQSTATHSQSLDWFEEALESIDLDLFCLWKAQAVVNENQALGRFRSWHFILTPSHLRLREALTGSGERHPQLQPSAVVFRCMCGILQQYTAVVDYDSVCQVSPRVKAKDWDLLHVLVASLTSAADKTGALRRLFWNDDRKEWNSAVRKVYQKLSLESKSKSKKRGRSSIASNADNGTQSKCDARPFTQQRGPSTFQPVLWHGDENVQAAPLALPLLRALTPDHGADIVTIVGHNFTQACQVKCHLVGKPTRWESFGTLQAETLKPVGTGCCTVDIAHVEVNQAVFLDAVGEVDVVVFVTVLDERGDDVHHPQQLSVGNPVYRFHRPTSRGCPLMEWPQGHPISQGPNLPFGPNSSPASQLASSSSIHISQGSGPGQQPPGSKSLTTLKSMQWRQEWFLLEMQEHISRLYRASAQEVELQALMLGHWMDSSEGAWEMFCANRPFGVKMHKFGLPVYSPTSCLSLQRRLPTIIAEVFAAKAQVAMAEASVRALKEQCWFTQHMALTICGRQRTMPRRPQCAAAACPTRTDRTSCALLVYVSQCAGRTAEPLACRRDAQLASALLRADGFDVKSVAEADVTFQRLNCEVSHIPHGLQRIVVWFLGHGLQCRPEPCTTSTQDNEVAFALAHTQCLGPHCTNVLRVPSFCSLVWDLLMKQPDCLVVVLDFCHSQGVADELCTLWHQQQWHCWRPPSKCPVSCKRLQTGAWRPRSLEVVYAAGRNAEAQDANSFSRSLVELILSRLQCSPKVGVPLHHAARLVCDLPHFQCNCPGISVVGGPPALSFGPWHSGTVEAVQAEVCLILEASDGLLQPKRGGEDDPDASDEEQISAVLLAGQLPISCCSQRSVVYLASPSPRSVGCNVGGAHENSPWAMLGPLGCLLWQEAQGRQQVWRTARMWSGAMAEALDRGRIVAEEEAELCYTLERKVASQHHVLVALGRRPTASSGPHRPMPVSFACQ
eukprot:GGOE01004418.1.p1 GENE.GGOE01004418.1~~GGOE01004418.1.p1  ORF type:complete len:1106 (+),score=130.94 GGOE01004418.1:29-3346(+)